MGANTLVSFFDRTFRLECGELSVSLSNIDELMTIWLSQHQEPMELITCRPVKNRNYHDEKEFFMRLMETETVCFFTVFLKEEVAGKISLSDYNIRNRSLEIGYSLLPQFHKKGIMTAAMRLLFEYIFSDLNINKVYAQTGEFNKASIHLLESLHFSRDAVLREHHELNGHLYDDFIYSLLAADYCENK